MTMVELFIKPDGGISEGGSYWNFALDTMLEVLLLLSRYHGKSLWEYVPEPVRKTARYGEAIWSETGDGFGFIPFNDVMPYARYSPLVVNFMTKIGAGPFWNYLSSRMNQQFGVVTNRTAVIAMVLYGDYVAEEQAYPEEFIGLDITGVTALCREDPRFGRTGLYAISGYSFPGHQHQDKGSLLLEAACTHGGLGG